jgi:flavin reductase (DIM6/NTAB) family NADH-FMN oxidoreductase RutF
MRGADMDFRVIEPTEINDNVFNLIGGNWMLITAGNRQRYNTMTASWGGMGVIWGKKVCFCVIRPTRHTYGFMESTDAFTLSFFDETNKDALAYCGSHSGRDVDKAKETGLTPLFGDNLVYFNEARLVLCLKKVYYHDIDPTHFVDHTIDTTHYPLKDYHRMYMGEITAGLTK